MAEEIEIRTADGKLVKKVYVSSSHSHEDPNADVLLISERRRMMLVIEEVVGSRLKPEMVERIVTALQKEGFRQD